MPSNDYPSTVASVLRRRPTFKPATITAIKRFRAAKPWQGTTEERVQKIQALYADLAAAYGIPVPGLTVHPEAVDCYSPTLHRIRLNARNLSVVTALHEFGHALGMNEVRTCRWSINLFRRFFPGSYSRLHHNGHMLVRRSS